MADHPRQHQALARARIGFEIPALQKLRIGLYRVARDLVEGDVLRREFGRGGDHHGMGDAIRIVDGPLQRLHPAQAAADHRGEALDAQRIRQHRLRLHPVLHRHGGKVLAPGFAGGGIGGQRPGTAATAAEVVQGDDVELARIDGLAGADAGVPPTRLRILRRVVASSVVVAGEGVAHQHGVALGGVQLAVGFVDQLEARQLGAALERERLVVASDLGLDQPYRLRQPGHSRAGSRAPSTVP